MNATRVTSGGGNDTDGPVSPDGRWLLFTSDRAGDGYRFYRMPVTGGAEPEPLFEGTGRLHSISYASRMLGFELDSGANGADALVVAVSDDGKPGATPILAAGGAGHQFSPVANADGTLVAYESTESGRGEVYVARQADPLMLRRDIRIWPGWGETLPSAR